MQNCLHQLESNDNKLQTSRGKRIRDLLHKQVVWNNHDHLCIIVTILSLRLQ
jgi:hypothetical protein